MGTDESREFNRMGFGAGGLPPLFFSHLNRNWNQHTVGNQKEKVDNNDDKSTLNLKMVSQIYAESETEYESPQESGHRSHMDASLHVVNEDDITKVLPIKKAKMSVVPSGHIRSHSGGKGRERYRIKKTESKFLTSLYP